MKMLNGWIKIHREISQHWIWKSPNRFQWWIDILLTVNHSDSKVLIKGNLIECKRGQSVLSLESWAKRWGVSKKTVKDFFELLQKDEMLVYEPIQITTRVTVCNYDTYQDKVNAKETEGKRKVNTEETDTLPKQECKEECKEEVLFASFWDSYHTITGLNKTDRDAAERYFKKLSLSNKQLAIQNIKPYFDSLSDKKYCKKARTYLADKNFNDEFVVKNPERPVRVFFPDLEPNPEWKDPPRYPNSDSRR